MGLTRWYWLYGQSSSRIKNYMVAIGQHEPKNEKNYIGDFSVITIDRWTKKQNT